MGHELASRLIVGLSGPVPTATEVAWLRHYQPAGVILFSRNCINYQQLSDLCTTLKQLVSGLEIMADHEGGPVSQLARALGRPPVARTLGEVDDLPLTASVHAETGRRLLAVGVTRVLAPVADVLTEARNPVIGARAFGGDAKLVERHTVAAVTGMLAAGVLVCLKHWPGHGGSLHDTHLSSGDTGAGAVSAPFVAGLTAGADAVMVGHLQTRDDAELPATLDREYLEATRKLLQQASGCRPQLIADDITMGGLRGAMENLGVSPGDGEAEGMAEPELLPLTWLAALCEAGCDRLLIRGLPLLALPLPREPSPASPTLSPSGATNVEFSDQVYANARHRAWALAGADFTAADLGLLWRDETVGDRWQVAGGDQGSAQEQLLPLLAQHFARVHSWDMNEAVSDRLERLLVTSHRPLELSGDRDVRLAKKGVCLVMGHPSLARTLSRYLGTGWRVGAVYDVSAADLFSSR